MNVHENATHVRAIVRKVTPCADGYGHDLQLEIVSNDSPDPAADFLKPAHGATVTAFAAQAAGLTEGTEIQATLGLAAGPTAERTVLRSAKPTGR